jgi:hypothetical protein
LVEPKPDPFAEAMLRLFDQPGERQRVAAAALAVAQQKYSRESYVRRTAEAYSRLGGSASAPSNSPALRRDESVAPDAQSAKPKEIASR